MLKIENLLFINYLKLVLVSIYSPMLSAGKHKETSAYAGAALNYNS